MTTPQEEQQNLSDVIARLDGEEGLSAPEAKLFGNVLKLSPEKMQEAMVRFTALTEVNTHLQTAYAKRNLIEGIRGDIDTQDIFETIKQLERNKMRIIRFAQAKEGRLGTADDQSVEDRKKILEKTENFEKIRASDVLFLKKKGGDIAGLLLVPEKDSFATVSRDTIKEQDSFIVNFGGNRSLDQIIGAGDILPPTVSRVRINGVDGERKNFPRPGYYTQEGQYLPVYDGDKIEIVKVGEVPPEFLAESTAAEDAWLREQRINDMADGDGKALSDLAEDKDLEQNAQDLIKARKDLGIDRSDEDTIDNGENLKGDALWKDEKFQARLAQVCDQLGVNIKHMKVILQAESGINPKAVNKISGATGLIQFMPKTAVGLGTTVSALRRMPSYDQLLYVMKYFMPYQGRLKSVQDLYLATFYPAAIGKTDDFVMGSQPGSKVSPERIARDNWIVAPGKSVITVADFKQYVDRSTRRYA